MSRLSLPDADGAIAEIYELAADQAKALLKRNPRWAVIRRDELNFLIAMLQRKHNDFTEQGNHDAAVRMKGVLEKMKQRLGGHDIPDDLQLLRDGEIVCEKSRLKSALALIDKVKLGESAITDNGKKLLEKAAQELSIEINEDIPWL